MAMEMRHVPIPPAQELVGSNTYHVQIMKASFFNESYDLNQTYSIQDQSSSSRHLTSTIGTRTRPTSNLDRHVLLHSSSHTNTRPSTLPPDVLQSSFQFLGPVPSPVPISQLQGLSSPLCEPVPSVSQISTGPFTRHHPPPKALSSLQVQSAVLMAKRDLHILVPKKNSVFCGGEGNHCDHGLSFGRSFRVGWGPNWTLVHSGCSLSSSKFQGGGVTKGGPFSNLVSKPMTEGHPIRVVIEQMSVNTSPDNCDSVSISSTLIIVHDP